MRTLLKFSVIATVPMMFAGFLACDVQAMTLTGAVNVPAPAQNYSPIEKVACNGTWGPHCGPGRTGFAAPMATAHVQRASATATPGMAMALVGGATSGTAAGTTVVGITAAGTATSGTTAGIAAAGITTSGIITTIIITTIITTAATITEAITAPTFASRKTLSRWHGSTTASSSIASATKAATAPPTWASWRRRLRKSSRARSRATATDI